MPTREERTLRRARNRAGTPTRTAQRRPVDPAEELTEEGQAAPEQVDAAHLTDGDPDDATPAEQPGEADSADGPDDTATVDEAGEADSADGSDAAQPVGRTTGRFTAWRPNPLTALLVVLLAGALAAAGVFGHRWYADRQLDAAHQAAVAAARQTTVNFVSVSAASVDRDLQRITAGATGEFKDQFTQGQAQVRAAVVENKVGSRGSVLRAALVSGDRDHAVVLVAVDATVKNVKTPDGRPSHYRIQVDMARDRHTGR